MSKQEFKSSADQGKAITQSAPCRQEVCQQHSSPGTRHCDVVDWYQMVESQGWCASAQAFLALPRVKWLDEGDLLKTPMEAVRNCSFSKKMLQVWAPSSFKIIRQSSSCTALEGAFGCLHNHTHQCLMTNDPSYIMYGLHRPSGYPHQCQTTTCILQVWFAGHM